MHARARRWGEEQAALRGVSPLSSFGIPDQRVETQARAMPAIAVERHARTHASKKALARLAAETPILVSVVGTPHGAVQGPSDGAAPGEDEEGEEADDGADDDEDGAGWEG